MADYMFKIVKGGKIRCRQVEVVVVVVLGRVVVTLVY